MEPNIAGTGRSTSASSTGAAWSGSELDGGGEGVSCSATADKLECAPEPVGACGVAESPAISSEAVRGLVESFEASSRASRTSPAATGAGDTNARRTSERAPSSYLDSGTTRSGDYFAGAAALKGQDPKTGVQTEVFTASAQFGQQNEVQAGLGRIGFAMGDGVNGTNFALNFEALTARANFGTHNDDGSEGANVGAMATGASVEATMESSGWQLTAGLSGSVGAAVSSGERDFDGDGEIETCFKVSVGPATLGFCTEFE